MRQMRLMRQIKRFNETQLDWILLLVVPLDFVIEHGACLKDLVRVLLGAKKWRK